MGIRQELQSHRVSRTVAVRGMVTYPVSPRLWQARPTTAPRTWPIASMSCQLRRRQWVTLIARRKSTHLETHAPRISTGGISER